MSGTHTPGPKLRFVQGVEDGIMQCHFLIYAEGKPQYIARVQSWTHNLDDAKAWADLIVTAVNSHAALQQRVAGLEEALGDMLGTLDAHTVVTENCDGTDDKYCDCVDRITRKAKAALTGSATVTAFGAMREALRRLTLSAHKLVVEVCGDSCNCARRGTCEKCMVRNDVRAGHDALALADGGAGGGGEGSGT
jgi:hypothetical protein